MGRINTLSCDLETYSSVDLAKCGVYKYAESPDFEILLFAYSVNEEPVRVVDVACGEKVPEYILAALTDISVEKLAYNAQFERVCLSNWLRRYYPEHFYSYGIPEDSVGGFLDPEGWKCSRIWGAYMGLPLSLKGVGAVLKLDEQKMEEGADLISYFCKPCRPTQKNGGRTRNLPCHDPEKWSLFKKYNKRDVEVELAIKARLAKYPVPDFIWDEYHLDQEINDRGILVDMTLVEQAIAIDARTKAYLRGRMCDRTGLENPNSVAQMKNWLSGRGIEAETLDKKAVREMLPDADDDVAEVLSCRQQLAKASVSKYRAMQKAVCADGRARGMFSFYGANRTGRWSGKIIQLQNLYKNSMDDLAEARQLVMDGNYEALEVLYDDIPEVLSELVRTAFVPKPGYKYIVSDFSAIEARVLSFLAGEQWRIDLFKNGGDIYCKSASQMFGVPVEKHGVNAHLRQKGKIAELACIAEGELVLTNHGEKPIEKVAANDLVWDGEDWVRHDGVVYRGEREVITYEGLPATPDHLVWVEGEPEPVQFGTAAALGAHLVQTGDGRRAIRLGENNQSGKTVEQKYEPLLCSYGMHRVRRNAMASERRPNVRKVERLSALFMAKEDSEMAGSAVDGGKKALRRSERQRVSELRGKRYYFRFPGRYGGRAILDSKIWGSESEHGTGQDRCQRKLRCGKSEICEQKRQSGKSTDYRAGTVRAGVLALQPVSCYEDAFGRNDAGRDHFGCGKSGYGEAEELENHKRTARLYDIRNAGQHHRFTVSGHLVHNCGYGGSVGALKAMGAIEMGLEEQELQPLVSAWREANPHIVRFWWDVDAAVKKAVINKTSVESHGFRFYYQSGMLFIDLPSGRRLSYVKPRIGVNRFGSESVTYEGMNMGKWTRLETYGPKVTENLVQAVSRDILAYAMKTLRYCFIVGSVHDELIIECNPGVSLQAVCDQMGRTPPWIPGLQLRADGYECGFYMKE